MAALYHSLFTEKGLELLRESIQVGSKLGITHMSFGDGNGALPIPDAKFTKMVKEVYRIPLNRLAPSKENANWLEADGIIPSAVGGFNIREVGLWAGNVMVAYANYPPTYKPTGDQGTAQIKTIRIVLQIDNTANFELKIDASVVMATIQAVEDAKLSVIEHTDKTKISLVESITELLEQDSWNGKTFFVKSFHKGKNKGSGNFVFDESKKLINDGGNCFFGWVRQVPESYLNVQNFGAIGDGSQNEFDHDAFVKISKVANSSTVNTSVIHIPEGNYIVGKQVFVPDTGFTIENVLNVGFSTMTEKAVLLKSDGAVIKNRDNMHFGIFDKNTKLPFETTMPFYPGTPSWAQDGNKTTRADLGYMLNFENLKNFTFSGKIELDGNAVNQNIGGKYGDTGWQLGAYGFRVVNIKQLSVENVYTHDHLLDGFYVAGYNSTTEPDIFMPDCVGSIRNIISSRNARQGCSFCGGQNISFYDCLFSDTATTDMNVRSMPMSGFDIEAEITPIRNARFYNCKFSNNAATQMVADSGDTRDVQFYGCRFLNSATGATVWVRKPQFKFFNCYINGYIEGQYGTNIESDRTLYQGCTITDDPKENFNSRGDAYLINASGANPIFDSCTFDFFKSGWIYDYGYSGTLDKLTVKNSVFNVYDIPSYAQFAMMGVYENLIINDLRDDPTKTTYPTLDGGRYNNVILRSPTGQTGIVLYGGSSLLNTRGAISTRSSNPYDGLNVTPFELKGFHVSGNQGINSLTKVAYSPALNLMNIQYNTGDTIHCTMPSSGIDKWICITSGLGSDSVWKKVPLVLQDI